VSPRYGGRSTNAFWFRSLAAWAQPLTAGTQGFQVNKDEIADQSQGDNMQSRVRSIHLAVGCRL
jgi:hypothetical protein